MRDFDPSKNYYKVLSVRDDATQAEIERMYRRQAVRLHPDRGGSEEAMKALNEAHTILRDPATRLAYDVARREGVGGRVEPRTRTSPSFSRGPRARHSPARTEADFVGRVIASFTFLGISLLFFFLVEAQWMFFLWPLRVMALGMIGVGVYYSHTAFKLKQQRLRSKYFRQAGAAAFWLVVAGAAYLLFSVMRLNH